MARKTNFPYSLADFELFAECTRAELEQAASLLTLVSVPAGEVILREGASGRQFVIVADGMAQVSRKCRGGSTPIGVVRSGDLLGEMSLLHRTPRSATVTTLTPTKLYAGTSAEFAGLLDLIPTAAAKIRRLAAERLEQNLAA